MSLRQKQKQKKSIVGKENWYLTENRLSINEMLCSANINNNTCHKCVKYFWILNLNVLVNEKI